MVPTCRESRVRLLEEVCRLDIVQSRRLAARLNIRRITGVQVDRVVGEVVGSTGVVEVTVGTDDDTRPVVLVD